MSVLEVKGLTKRYGDQTVLDGLDLAIGAGEVVALLGPNGAGKTTLVSIVSGLRPFESGSVRVAGIDVAAHPRDARDHIGLAPQELGIYPSVSVRNNMRVFGELAGLRGKALNDRIAELAEALELTDLLPKIAAVLSGGQKRRLHTAIALMSKPSLLLLDEPTVGADIDSRHRLLQVVRRLADEGAAICYTTHYLIEVEELGARVAILHEGRIAADAPVGELIARNGHAHVELGFEGPAPDVSGAVRDPADATVIRLTSQQPGLAAASAIAALGDDVGRIRSVEIVREGLEAAYRSITGTVLDGDGSHAELADVVAS